MQVLRKYVLWACPHLIWLLALSLCYAVGSVTVYDVLQTQVHGAAFYYVKGLLLILPLVFFAYVVKKSSNLWQFVLAGMVVITGLHLLINCWVFTGFAIVIFLLRGGNRIKQQLQILEEELPEESMLDHPTKFLLLIPVVFFLLTGYTTRPFLQEVSLYHFVAMAIFFFVLEGLQRFEGYVRLSELNANVPSARILETGARIFVGSALLLALVLVPALRSQYRFVPIEFAFDAIEAAELPEQEIRPATNTGNMADTLADIAEGDPLIDLSRFWALMDKIAVVAFYLLMLYALYRLLKLVIVNFDKTQVEKNDVIESTFGDQAETLPSARRADRVAELFDFSPAMKIRRRYKKELRRHRPMAWQTPSEMEAMAHKDIPELHAQYEQARYGK